MSENMTDKKKIPVVRWLAPMNKVMLALTPALLASIYFFGWRVFIMFVIVNISGFLAEYIFAKQYKEPVNSSVFVTNFLFVMIIPPTLPYWMAVVGIVFSVIFGKMVFGGFGKNIFNPALAGRAFIYVTFASYMTGNWAKPAKGLMGGILKYTPDAITSATVLSTGENIDMNFYINALIGKIPGSIGETSAILLLIGGIYLVYKRVASKTIVIWTFIGMLVMQGILLTFDLAGNIDILTSILSGGFILGLFFMATDPVSAPKQESAKIFYGIFIGVMTSVIRTFSVWPEGMMFAILLANMFAPLMDIGAKEWTKRKKSKQMKAA
ncbi:MAG: RnfABCDGE type electron transport complex subunit D [Candidatus Delongbacteria bacterium]|jgi:Na+-transporting NADH:ubiquinone oxidoreductase subunit B|nr:RnfABCDGE type electron transport complex subunit D [Candidatus Delongbacteria bacterium]